MEIQSRIDRMAKVYLYLIRNEISVCNVCLGVNEKLVEVFVIRSIRVLCEIGVCVCL